MKNNTWDVKSIKLDGAINNFTHQMNERLSEKEKKGWNWWNKEKEFPNFEIIVKLKEKTQKIIEMENNNDENDVISYRKECVDIANLAMFLHHRISNKKW